MAVVQGKANIGYNNIFITELHIILCIRSQTATLSHVLYNMCSVTAPMC